MRWERDNGTVLSPNAFIPVYENNGKIIELDFYVFETVVEFIAENLKAGREQVPISINASSFSCIGSTDDQHLYKYFERNTMLIQRWLRLNLPRQRLCQNMKVSENYLTLSSCMGLRRRWMILEADILS